MIMDRNTTIPGHLPEAITYKVGHVYYQYNYPQALEYFQRGLAIE
jgi:hypothetical protein